jgi:hypothetical protein
MHAEAQTKVVEEEETKTREFFATLKQISKAFVFVVSLMFVNSSLAAAKTPFGLRTRVFIYHQRARMKSIS